MSASDAIVACAPSGAVGETVLGIDIGTSATNAVLARPDGTLVGQARREHSLFMPRAGWAEHDATGIWWRELGDVCAELVPLAGGGLRAVCVAGIGVCVVPCDRWLQPVRPAISYAVDTRAEEEVEELERRYGADAIGLAVARERGALTILFTGETGAAAAGHADFVLRAPSGWTPRIQETHVLFVHLLGEFVDRWALAEEPS